MAHELPLRGAVAALACATIGSTSCATHEPATADIGPEEESRRAVLAELRAMQHASAGLDTLRSGSLSCLASISEVTPADVIVEAIDQVGPHLTVRARGGDPSPFAAALCSQPPLVDCALAAPAGGSYTVRARQSMLPPEPVSAEAVATADPLVFDAIVRPQFLLLARAIPFDPDPDEDAVRQLARKSGLSQLSLLALAPTQAGRFDFSPYAVSGLSGYHQLAIFLDRVSKLSRTTYWASLRVEKAAPPPGRPPPGLARAQFDARSGWPGDAALAFEGELRFASWSETPGTAPSPSVAYPLGETARSEAFYNPSGRRDPMFPPLPPWVASAPEARAAGRVVTREVPLESVLRLVAAAAALEVTAPQLSPTRLALDGTFDSPRATAEALLRGTGHSTRSSATGLVVVPPRATGTASAALA